MTGSPPYRQAMDAVRFARRMHLAPEELARVFASIEAEEQERNPAFDLRAVIEEDLLASYHARGPSTGEADRSWDGTYQTALALCGAELPASVQQELAKAYAREAAERALQKSAVGPDHAEAEAVLDGATFGLTAHADEFVAWGDGKSTALVPRGEFVVFVGNDGSYKTTTAHNLILGMADLPGFESLLGEPVAALPSGSAILYVAADRPVQSKRAWKRLTASLTAAELELVRRRIYFYPKAPPIFGDDPTILTEWVETLEKAHDTRFGAVFIDNVSDCFGDLNNTTDAMVAGNSLNRLAATGRVVVGLHHPRKGHRGTKIAESLDEVYGGRMFYRGCGSAVAFHADRGTEGVCEVRTLKEPLGSTWETLVVWDNTTGRPMMAIDSFDNPVYETLRRLGNATASELWRAIHGEVKAPPADERMAIRRELDRATWARKTDETRDRGTIWEFVG